MQTIAAKSTAHFLIRFLLWGKGPFNITRITILPLARGYPQKIQLTWSKCKEKQNSGPPRRLIYISRYVDAVRWPKCNWQDAGVSWAKNRILASISNSGEWAGERRPTEREAELLVVEHSLVSEIKSWMLCCVASRMQNTLFTAVCLMFNGISILVGHLNLPRGIGSKQSSRFK